VDKIKHAFFVQCVFVVRLMAFEITIARVTNTQKTYVNFLTCFTLYSPVVTSCTTEFSIQQDRQCTYTVTLRRVRTSVVAVEKQ